MKYEGVIVWEYYPRTVNSWWHFSIRQSPSLWIDISQGRVELCTRAFLLEPSSESHPTNVLCSKGEFSYGLFSTGQSNCSSCPHHNSPCRNLNIFNNNRAWNCGKSSRQGGQGYKTFFMIFDTNNKIKTKNIEHFMNMSFNYFSALIAIQLSYCV